MRHSDVISVLEKVSKIRAKKFQIATTKNESEENEKCILSPSFVLKIDLKILLHQASCMFVQSAEGGEMFYSSNCLCFPWCFVICYYKTEKKGSSIRKIFFYERRVNIWLEKHIFNNERNTFFMFRKQSPSCLM